MQEGVTSMRLKKILSLGTLWSALVKYYEDDEGR